MKDFFLETGRLVLGALVSWLLTEGAVAGLFELAGISVSIELKAMIITVVLIVLKSIDRALHETKVAEKGLARF